MSVRRAGWLAALVFLLLLWLGCGQIYRPVVIPCSTGGVPGCPVETNPTPANFHWVLGISTNVPNYPGAAMQIDVSGDSVVGETPASDASKPNLGDNPTHAAISPNNSKVFVASAGSVLPGGLDVISSFTPVLQSTLATGLGTVNTMTLPSGSQPVFLNTTQNNALYVANFGTNSVSSINTNSNVVTITAAVGVNPVALAETPGATQNGSQKIYVANQGDSTVSSLNAVDLTSNNLTGFTGVTPVWVVARGDSQKVYVLTQGDGKLVTIDTATDTATTPDCSATPTLCVGPGANFLFYDPYLNRLYVTNPVSGMVYVFSDTGPTADIPTLLKAISISAAASSPCTATSGCSPVTPVSVTALADQSRFYVASYQTATACPDPNVMGACVIPELTVFDANSFAVKYPSAPSLTLLTWPPACTPTSTTSCPPTGWPFATNQYAVPPVPSCVTAATYSPATTRFRMFTVAAADSSRVYVSMCDAGAVAVVNTTDANTNNSGNGLPPDTLATDLLAAYGAGPVQPDGQTAPQNPIFLFMGQ